MPNSRAGQSAEPLFPGLTLERANAILKTLESLKPMMYNYGIETFEKWLCRGSKSFSLEI
jgi:hypothetical protein